MPTVMGLKETAKVIGLTLWELRTGALSGKYPHIRGGKGGKNSPYIFDIELLRSSIQESAKKNAEQLKQERIEAEANPFSFGMSKISE